LTSSLAPRPKIAVRVWRLVAGIPQVLFVFVGPIDALALCAVIQQVRSLTRGVPGIWRVEVRAVGLDERSLRDITDALTEMRRLGMPARLAHRARWSMEPRMRFAPGTLQSS
jgi:hypothetical protein